MMDDSTRILFHDMQNRLASMKSAAELCSLGEHLSPEDAQYIKTISVEIDALSKLMNSLHERLKTKT